VSLQLIIVGGGGFGREVFEYAKTIENSSGLTVKGFLDRTPGGLEPYGLSSYYLGDEDSYHPSESDRFIIGVGDPSFRRQLAQKLSAKGCLFTSIIHPSAYVSPTAEVSEGVIIAPFAMVGTYAKLEPHVVLNSYASCGHNSKIGAFSVLSPYATANGDCLIGEGVFLGTHSSLGPGKSIQNNSKVSSGTSVNTNIVAGSLVSGERPKSRVMFSPF
jgi:sugar O-acyltransferase (sialic acid O-acetyltransferase NeuD family)